MVDTIGLVNAVAGAPSYNGRMLRQLNAVGFAGATSTRPLGARSGVRPGTPATTVTATSTTWTCQPFAGLLDGQAAAEAGPYAFAFDAVATGAVAAASASIARVDIIYVQIDDPSESDGSTVPAVTRKYLAGTVASTAPATPARSIVIAHINVPTSGGGSPTVTWKAPYCAAAGGVVDFNTKAELDLWTTATQGQRVRVLASGVVHEYFGAYNASSNPGGATPAGWYPAAGTVFGAAVRSASAYNIGTAMVVVSDATSLTVEAAVGLTFNNGWVVPATGIYELTAFWRGGGAIDAYIGFGVGATPEAASIVQQWYGGQLTILKKFTAGDTVKMFARASAVTPWLTAPANGGYGIKWVGVAQ